ncbi:hypothetical protein Gotur_017621 [Gossypium turneri]
MFLQRYAVNQGHHECGFPLVDQCKESHSQVCTMSINSLEGATQLEYHQFDLDQDFEHFYTGYNGTEFCREDDAMPRTYSYLPSICPSPSAFLGPKCALWDCPRPAQGLGGCLDYCSSFHAALAMNEGPPGMGPVLRPGGIGLKDGLLFAALSAKTQGKDVGIPECQGAATAKSPWNAPGMSYQQFFTRFYRQLLLSSLTFWFLMVNQLESGSFSISLEEHLKVGTESRGLCRITMGVAGTSRESKS